MRRFDGQVKTLAELIRDYKDHRSTVLTRLTDLGQWQAWTPFVGGVTIGTGGNAGVTARYVDLGSFVRCRVAIVLGTAGMSVAGFPSFSLPLTAVALPAGVTRLPVGNAILGDAGAIAFAGSVEQTNTFQVNIRRLSISGTAVIISDIGATTPFTWGASDWITADWSYEKAIS